MTAGGLSSRWQQLPPNSVVTLRYEVDGKAYDQVGYLKGRTDFIQVHSKVPVRIDPHAPPVDGVHPALVQLGKVLAKYLVQYPEQWLVLDSAFVEDAV